MTLSPAMCRLIDALADAAVEDYLREVAEPVSAETDARAERVPLPPMGEAA